MPQVNAPLALVALLSMQVALGKWAPGREVVAVGSEPYGAVVKVLFAVLAVPPVLAVMMIRAVVVTAQGVACMRAAAELARVGHHLVLVLVIADPVAAARRAHELLRRGAADAALLGHRRRLLLRHAAAVGVVLVLLFGVIGTPPKAELGQMAALDFVALPVSALALLGAVHHA
eukprot:TRINITY_DN14325_c0_g1_i2.p2 TRINITY_DN14325_c0_g1~~TRINITY_DN14325_c0_g1_i2.p2  ORF type:complete len:174 (-),score=23.78 TRINITY_DN14325_c0_g1_i2:323-844(-)